MNAMNMDKQQYSAYVKERSENSPLVKDMLKAFFFGGAICTVGQGVSELWRLAGMDKPQASAATSVTMVFIGALLTGLSLYDNLAKHGGAGTIIPITGFANSIVSPAMEFKSEGLVLGMAAKMFVIAGPVLVYGITASVVYGIILALFRLV
ncbi:MAG TPA: stage V sporulation protein AC [Terriglobales bacterium]|nr:stage V sporulation protein AC [Candidatus Acidoferrum sp.]HWQ51283.1 stage V sporulation protein AC [Terriglobales bacterium]